MTWEVPDRTEDYYPEGACSVRRDLADAADVGVARSFQQEEIRLRRRSGCSTTCTARMRLREDDVAPRPAGVPDSALSIGPRLRALAVYLVVFQHVPVERCRELIADVAGVAVSEGFIHSCLAKAASLAGEVVALIRTLITASAVAGFDETTLRSGPAGEKKYVHGAFTERYSAFWLGTRSLDAMQDAGIPPRFRRDRGLRPLPELFPPPVGAHRREPGMPVDLLRDYQDCAESYPGAVWPAQAQRALRGLIHAWHAAREQGLDAIPAGVRNPLEHEFRHAVLAGLASVPRVPGRRTARNSGPAASCWNFATTVAATCSCSPRTRASGPRTFRHLGLVLRCVIAGYGLAAGTVLPWWLGVASGMIVCCDRCAGGGAVRGSA